jgi:threonine/homoserine/homoserine lactone efflux protein
MSGPAPLDLFARGSLLGFSIAAPVGPIGLLCIQRTLAGGRARGLASGLGAAAADGVYGALAAFGLTAVSGALVAHADAIRVAGGLLLLALGARTFLARPATAAAAARGAGLAGAFASTFALTLANPITILSFVAVFAGLGLGVGATTPARSLALLAGVVGGSAAWWLLLSGMVDRLRERFDAHRMTWVNRASGAVLVAFGVTALVAAWQEAR